MVQWLRRHASTAESTSSIPGWGIRIPHATRCSQKKRRRDGESRDGRGRVGEEKEKKLSFGSCNEKQRGHYLHFQAQKELDLEEKPVII